MSTITVVLLKEPEGARSTITNHEHECAPVTITAFILRLFAVYPLPGYGHGDCPERFTVFGRSLGLGYIVKRKVEDA